MKSILTASLSLALIAPSAALADDAKKTHFLTLQGHGEVKAKPDLAMVEMGTLSQAVTAKAALAANTAEVASILALLKADGIDDKDIQTSNFSVSPRYDNAAFSGRGSEIVGYDVANSVTVKVHKLADLGGILDQAVGKGSNQINNITFGINEPQPLQDEARQAAVADALRRAKLLTQAAGTTLGAIAAITESGGYAPVPMRGRVMKMDSQSEASAPVPLAQGEMSVSADVSMVWELE